MADEKIAVVTHYYDKIKVAIIKVLTEIKVGDKVLFVRGGEDLFEQTIDSMQVEHNSVDAAKAGDVVGLRVENEVKEGTEIFKI